ncbi:hypothetical protein BDN70DRAFT_575327 [Pholiota conissans]|uniref:Uncharacterized protein n=1 Tax=Pholiota conissans TaxID=109636 RepID=A0A9P5YP61_9AGAR|nr:hypothetical protein BDN70DRAFT_575327 [Pholiota conissans]
MLSESLSIHLPYMLSSFLLLLLCRYPLFLIRQFKLLLNERNHASHTSDNRRPARPTQYQCQRLILRALSNTAGLKASWEGVKDGWIAEMAEPMTSYCFIVLVTSEESELDSLSRSSTHTCTSRNSLPFSK